MSEDETPEQSSEPTSKPTPEQTQEPTPKPFKVEILDKIATLIAAAFGFVAAFAWNETFKVLLLGGMTEADRPIVLIGYALLVTVIAVLLTIAVARAAGKAKKSIQ